MDAGKMRNEAERASSSKEHAGVRNRTPVASPQSRCRPSALAFPQPFPRVPRPSSPAFASPSTSGAFRCLWALGSPHLFHLFDHKPDKRIASERAVHPGLYHVLGRADPLARRRRGRGGPGRRGRRHCTFFHAHTQKKESKRTGSVRADRGGHRASARRPLHPRAAARARPRCHGGAGAGSRGSGWRVWKTTYLGDGERSSKARGERVSRMVQSMPRSALVSVGSAVLRP